MTNAKTTDSKELTPAVAYIRVSKERDDMISPELQRRAIDTFAEREGFRVVKVIEDIDLTGTTFDNRRVGEVLEDIKAGAYSAVLLWKWSRWGRHLEHSLAYLRQVEEAGGEVRAATEDIDAKTAMGKFSRGMSLLVADFESQQKSEGWKAVQARRAEHGLPHGGAPRFGYVKQGQAFVPDPVTGPALAEAYERYAAGTPMQRIADDMNARGIRTVKTANRGGNPIKPAHLLQAMDSGFAAGWLRSRSKPSGKAKERGGFDVWTRGAHEPLISEETWQAFQARRKKSAATPARSRTAAHSLSGLVRCECGARMVAAKASNTATWRCAAQQDYKGCEDKDGVKIGGTSARMERLEAFVWAWVQENAEGEGLARAEADRLRAAKRAVSDSDRITGEIKRLEGRMSRLVDLFMDDGIDRQSYDVKRAAVSDEIEKAQDALAAAQAAARDNGAEAREVFRTIAEVWEGADAHVRREMLSKVIRYVRVNKGTHWNPDKYVIKPAWEPEGE